MKHIFTTFSKQDGVFGPLHADAVVGQLGGVRVVEDLLEGLEHGHAVREYAVREQERV